MRKMFLDSVFEDVTPQEKNTPNEQTQKSDKKLGAVDPKADKNNNKSAPTSAMKPSFRPQQVSRPGLKAPDVKNNKPKVPVESSTFDKTVVSNYKALLDKLTNVEQSLKHLNVIPELRYFKERGGFGINEEYFNNLPDDQKRKLDELLLKYNEILDKLRQDYLEKELNARIYFGNAKAADGRGDEKNIQGYFAEIPGNPRPISLTSFPLSVVLKTANLFGIKESLVSLVDFTLTDDFIKSYDPQSHSFKTKRGVLPLKDAVTVFNNFISMGNIPLLIPIITSNSLNEKLSFVYEPDATSVCEDLIDYYTEYKHFILNESINEEDLDETTTSGDIAPVPYRMFTAFPLISLRAHSDSSKDKKKKDLILKSMGLEPQTVSESVVSTEVVRIASMAPLKVVSNSELHPDFVDKSNDAYYFKSSDTTLIRMLMRHWEVKEVDPGRMSILSVFTAKYLNGIFDSFIYGVFTEKEFAFILSEIRRELVSMDFAPEHAIKSILLEDKFILKEVSVNAVGEYLLAPNFVYRLYSLTKGMNLDKKGLPFDFDKVAADPTAQVEDVIPAVEEED